MPSYQFHFIENALPTAIVSHELSDIVSAKCEAAQAIGAMLCDAGARAWEGSDWSVSVSDDKGLTLFSLFITPVEAPALQRAMAALPEFE